MSFNAKKIRNYIGNDQLEEALRELIDCLETMDEGHDLLDQAILQKGRLKDYKKKAMAGLEDDKDVNSVRVALLNITREIENRHKGESEGDIVKPQPQNNQPPSPQAGQTDDIDWDWLAKAKQQNTPPQPAQYKPYIAQCFFNGDANHYLVTPANQVIMVNPMTNFTMAVASRVASQDPNFAWVYLFPNGFFYNIDHAGAIWGVNAFGMPMQMGYVQYF